MQVTDIQYDRRFNTLTLAGIMKITRPLCERNDMEPLSKTVYQLQTQMW